MLTTAISVIEAVTKQARIFLLHDRGPACAKVLDDLEFCTPLLTSFRNRSQALEQRLDNEINLVCWPRMPSSSMLVLC
jgi:hypothetical protein